MGQKLTNVKRVTAETFQAGAIKDVKAKRRLKGGRGRDTLTLHSNHFPRPRKLEILLDRPPASVKSQELNGWSPYDKSTNMYVREDDVRVAHRHPVAQSTDGIRGEQGYSKGLHVWDLTWNTRQRGTHAVIGVATKSAALNAPGYHSLVGANSDSWGWDLGRHKLFHNQKTHSTETYPRNLSDDANFVVPETVRCILDMDEGTLAFEVDGQYLGVAFTGLRGKTVYPCISAVWGHCEIGLYYVGYLHPEPLPLMDLCRLKIRQTIGKENMTEELLEQFDLPKQMKQYLVYKW